MIMGRIKDFLRKEPRDWFFGPVEPADSALPGTKPTVVEAESAYVSLYLESMRVSAGRVRAQSFYGTVTSTVGIASRSGQHAEIVAVATPSALRGVDPQHLDRVVIGRIPLVGSVPYRGGGLDIEIGLFAFPASYLLGPYLDLLGEVAAVASAFLPPAGALASTALMPPVRKGLDLLLGTTTDARLEVGLAHSWDQPETGYYAVVTAPETPGGFRIGARGRLLNPDGSEVHAAYLVLRLDAHQDRHNWEKIPDVFAAYQVIEDAARRGDLVAARDALAAFRRTAVFSPDLLASDGQRLYNLVEVMLKQAFPGTGTAGVTYASGLPPLADIPLFERKTQPNGRLATSLPGQARA
jgi:hypothetical protein